MDSSVKIKNIWQKSSLTFTLDLEDTYSILRVERSDLARRKRVPPLHTRRNGGWSLHWFDERLRANHGHHTVSNSLSPPKNACGLLSRVPHGRITSVGPCEDNRGVCVRIYRQLCGLWFTSSFAFEYLMSRNEWRSQLYKMNRIINCVNCCRLVFAPKTNWQIITNN